MHRENDDAMTGFKPSEADSRHKHLIGLGIFLGLVTSLAVAGLVLSLTLSWNRVITAGNTDKSLNSRLNAIEDQLEQTENLLEDIQLLV